MARTGSKSDGVGGKQVGGKQVGGKRTVIQPPVSPAPPGKAAAPKSRAQPPGRVGTMTEGQRAYEAKRAAKKGVTLEKHVATKERVAKAAAKSVAKAAAKPAAAGETAKRPGLLRRLFGRSKPEA